MKFYNLAMIIFLLSLSMSIINYIDVVGVQYRNQQYWVAEASDDNILNQSYGNEGLDDEGSTDYGNYPKGLSMLTIIFHATIGFPFLLKSFGLDPFLAFLLSAPLYIVYIVGIAQFISKNPMEGMK